MNQAAPANELERRKQLRIRLRNDLVIEPAKYEGRTYYVVKDPVSLRYYRLKDNEQFLLQFLNGKHTLEEAQKAYEKRFRPDRLKLEDLEAFAQQLLTAGLAQSDSPRAGKQLYERRTKRKRTEWMQTLTNILYIKIPIIDPDRILNRMLAYTRWIFTFWFFLLSVSVMTAAGLLVATHFEMFRSKLPSYHEFFSFKTVIYLYFALAVVKVIHEFGHGLSCKNFGGEVHEMGALFLCLSPALYCNVSDAWTLPNKWHRIIISAAGIYVELIIAALATFVWWNTPTQPFVNNMALSLMVVCSVSTVVFNANPLMRYDGYYVLADWLEIPNLRERSNRFLKNLMLEHCLGIEVQPEGYMELWRRILFVTYAVTSYVYRWVVTFAILWFMYNFLRPYKLEVISSMLTFAAGASMVGWPLYNLGKNLHRRGRIPDMKRWRVVLSGSVVAALVLFVCLVPVPVNRIRGVGLVQPQPDALAQVFIRYPGRLEELKVRPGDHVRKGDLLAVFVNHDLDNELDAARTDLETHEKHVRLLDNQRSETTASKDRAELDLQRADVESKRAKAATKVQALEKTRSLELTVLAPRDGVIGLAPGIEEVGRFFDPTKDQNQGAQPLFTVIEPGQLRVCLPIETPEFNLLKENLEAPTDAAQATHRLLRKRVNVAYEGVALSQVLDDLKRQAGDLPLELDARAGQVGSQKVDFKGSHMRLRRVLDAVLGRFGLGYVVLSEKGNARDGYLVVRPGRERGFPEGERSLVHLDVTLRVQGRDSHTWKGQISRLPESDPKAIPLALSNRAGGPVAVKPGTNPNGGLIPQTQYYLVYIDVDDPDTAIHPGTFAQVKVHCHPETCMRWLWRKVNDAFNLGLI